MHEQQTNRVACAGTDGRSHCHNLGDHPGLCAFALTILLATVCRSADFDGQITVLLDVNATTLIVSDSGTGTYSSTFNYATKSGGRMRIAIAVTNVPPNSSTTYTSCSDPCSKAVNMNNGYSYLWAEYVDSSGNPLSPPQYVGRQTIPQMMLPCAASITFPVEVIGQDRYVTCQQFSATSPPSSGLLFHMRINNHGYQQIVCDSSNYCDWSTKLAYNICQSSNLTGTCTGWQQINNTNVVSEDQAKWIAFDQLHPLAGQMRTVEVHVPIPSGALANGTNTIGWRFNGTDGITSGARILEWAILDSSTKQTLTQLVVSSNVATATCSSACGAVSGDDWLIEQAPMKVRAFNGLRHLTGGSGSTFTFATCGSGNGFYAISCETPDGTYKVPVTQATANAQTNYPQTRQQHMYATKIVAPAISAITYDNPATYSAGSGNATAGHTFFTTAALVTPNNPQFAVPNHNNSAVHCSSCHSDDTPWGGSAGMDLAYFNYSPHSLYERTVFHGGSETDALNVVAYIIGLRSTVTVPTNARPFNPPQMPGAGLDSGALTSWDAGCGIDCQLEYDCDLGYYMTGVVGCTTGLSGGTFTNWAVTPKFNYRELPIPYQIMDWNSCCLPAIHPKDAYPNIDFFSSTPYTEYQALETAVTAQTAVSYTTAPAPANYQFIQDVINWEINNLIPTYFPVNGSNAAGYWNATNNIDNNSGYQWGMSKLFEIMHPTLEGFCSQYYTTGLGWGARPSGSYDSRCWIQSRNIFNSAYHETNTATHHTPLLDAQRYPLFTGQVGSTNDAVWLSQGTSQYVWSVVNACNYHESNDQTRDVGYYQNFQGPYGSYTPQVFYSIFVNTLSLVQCGIDTGTSTGSNIWFAFGSGWPNGYARNFAWTTTADTATLFTQQANALYSAVTSCTNCSVANWRTFLAARSDTCSGTGVTSAWNGQTQSMCNMLAGFLAVANSLGANSTSLGNLATWANSIVNSTVWTGHNFTTTDLGASCSSVDVSGGSASFFWPFCSNML